MAFINDALLRIVTAVGGLRARLADERGQDLLEYALLGGFIAVGFAVAAALILPGAFNTMATEIKECIDFSSATSCGPDAG